MLGLLLKPITGPIATGAAILALALAVGQCSRAVKAEQKLAKAEAAKVKALADYDQCKANRTTLEAAISDQNAKVQALAKESAERLAASQKATREAEKVAAKLRKDAASILNAKPGADLCKSASDLIEASV